MKFLSLDFETSGTDPHINAPVSLGVAACEDVDGGLVIHDRAEWLIKPKTHYKTGAVERCYDERAARIHGYSLEQLERDGIPAAIVAGNLDLFIKNNGLRGRPQAAYNMPFDVGFLSTLLFLSGEYDFHTKVFRSPANPCRGQWFDVMTMTDSLETENRKLETVAAHLGMSRTSETHGALEDAILCAEVLVRLRPRGKE